MLAYLILVIAFIVLAVALIKQIYRAFKEKLKNRQRLFVITLMTLVLTSSFLMPYGVIDFDKLTGKNVLEAYREGSANCTINYKLKENKKFRATNVCFGVSQVSGNYEIKNDTIYFTETDLFGRNNGTNKIGIIKPLNSKKDKKLSALLLYDDKNDRTAIELVITRNELNEMPNR